MRVWLVCALLSTLLSTVRVRGFSFFGFGGGGGEGQKAAEFLESQRELVAQEQARGQTRLGPEGDGVHAALRCTNPHSNKSHLLFASRVDDGVCDCCSGIDEPRRIVVCPDTCLEQAQHEVALRATRQAAYLAGSQVRAAAAASALARLEAHMAPAPGSGTDPAASLEQLTRQRDFQQKAQAERLAARDERVNDVRLNTRPRIDAIVSIEGWEDMAALGAALMDLFGVTRESVDEYVPADMVEDGEEEDTGAGYGAAGGEDGDAGGEGDAGEEGAEEGAHGDAALGSVCLTLRSMDHRMEALPCPRGATAELVLERLRELTFRLLEGHAADGAEAAGRVQMLLVHYRLHGVFGEDAVRFAREANVSDPQSCLAAFPAVASDQEDGPEGSEGSESSGQPSQAAQMNCDTAAALSEALQLLLATKQDVDNNAEGREAIARGADTLAQIEADMAALKTRTDAAAKARGELEQFDGFLEFLALRDDNACLRRTDGSYSYSACLCDSVYQQDAAGNEELPGFSSGGGEDDGRHRQGTSLGTFDRLERNADTGGIDMHFKDGQHCHAFGPRSAVLRLECGAQRRLLSAAEPSTCFYELRGELPEACGPAFAELHGLSP